MKKYMLVLMVALIGLLAGCNVQTIGADEYFVQIMGDGEEFGEDDRVRYAYDLIGYNEDGNALNLVFTANKNLRHDAFLKIYYKEKKEEVILYEEVAESEVPEAALEQLVE